MAITYKTIIAVSIDDEHVGEIRSVEGGFKYFPTFSTSGGELFTTIEAVKASLED